MIRQSKILFQKQEKIGGYYFEKHNAVTIQSQLDPQTNATLDILAKFQKANFVGIVTEKAATKTELLLKFHLDDWGCKFFRHSKMTLLPVLATQANTWKACGEKHFDF